MGQEGQHIYPCDLFCGYVEGIFKCYTNKVNATRIPLTSLRGANWQYTWSDICSQYQANRGCARGRWWLTCLFACKTWPKQKRDEAHMESHPHTWNKVIVRYVNGRLSIYAHCVIMCMIMMEKRHFSATRLPDEIAFSSMFGWNIGILTPPFSIDIIY